MTGRLIALLCEHNIQEISKTMQEIDQIDGELNKLFEERKELEDRVSNLPNLKYVIT